MEPASGMSAVQEIIPPAAPPAPGGRLRDDPKEWARVNLFSSVSSTVLSVCFGGLLVYCAYRVVRYVLVTGRWEIVRAGQTSLMLGLNYPRDDASLLRPWISVGLLAAVGGLVTGVAARRRGSTWWESARPWIAVLVVGAVLLAVTRTATPKLLGLAVLSVLLAGRVVGARLPEAVARRLWIVYAAAVVLAALVLLNFEAGAWDEWGGLLLSLYVATIGIVASFPLGVLLALGRRSKLPVVRAVSIAYIELIRGVPLITLLFAGDLALRFFLPQGADPPGRVNRAVIMVVLFTAAYIAEIVRGGLQGVPKGQIEAGYAIGLGRIVMLRKVVLPQALRSVIPAIVGQFISLFKDTSLLTIIGLRELIGVAETVTSQPEFRNQGLLPEILAFVGLLFWVCCYSMSRASQRLETRMGVGIR